MKLLTRSRYIYIYIYNQIESILAFKLRIRKFSFALIDNLILTTVNIDVETINQNRYTYVRWIIERDLSLKEI